MKVKTMYNPCRIYFADNALQRARGFVSGFGTKAFIVTGKGSALRSGALDELLAVLREEQLGYHIFNKVKENPDMDLVMSGAAEFAVFDCNFIIAIGGGSPIDAAKAISLAVANKLDKANLFNTQSFRTAVPVIAIPTTSGTGSEVTPYSVLTDQSSKKKAGFGSELAFPKLAVLEPRYTLSMSRSVTLHTGIDALSHLLEGIYSNKRSSLLYPLIFDGIKTIYEYLPLVLAEPDNLAARNQMMKASLYGGLTIAHTSTTLQHSIGYPLTGVYDVPHGLANGVVMKSIMDLYYPAVAEVLEELFSFMEITRTKFYEWLEALELSMNFKLPSSFIEERLPEVLSSRNMANNPYDIDAEDIKSILMGLE